MFWELWEKKCLFVNGSSLIIFIQKYNCFFLLILRLHMTKVCSWQFLRDSPLKYFLSLLRDHTKSFEFLLWQSVLKSWLHGSDVLYPIRCWGRSFHWDAWEHWDLIVNIPPPLTGCHNQQSGQDILTGVLWEFAYKICLFGYQRLVRPAQFVTTVYIWVLGGKSFVE